METEKNVGIEHSTEFCLIGFLKVNLQDISHKPLNIEINYCLCLPGLEPKQ